MKLGCFGSQHAGNYTAAAAAATVSGLRYLHCNDMY
jgi:hypothetical protein